VFEREEGKGDRFERLVQKHEKKKGWGGVYKKRGHVPSHQKVNRSVGRRSRSRPSTFCERTTKEVKRDMEDKKKKKSSKKRHGGWRPSHEEYKKLRPPGRQKQNAPGKSRPEKTGKKGSSKGPSTAPRDKKKSPLV